VRKQQRAWPGGTTATAGFGGLAAPNGSCGPVHALISAFWAHFARRQPRTEASRAVRGYGTASPRSMGWGARKVQRPRRSAVASRRLLLVPASALRRMLQRSRDARARRGGGGIQPVLFFVFSCFVVTAPPFLSPWLGRCCFCGLLV
jgi:hypothetical protein